MSDQIASTGSVVLEVSTLPDGPLDASAEFHAEHLADARNLLEDDAVSVLTIHLPHAPPDHDDWRRALARDLARTYAPKRVNVVGAREGFAAEETLSYLVNAPGVTGQYCPTHE